MIYCSAKMFLKSNCIIVVIYFEKIDVFLSTVYCRKNAGFYTLLRERGTSLKVREACLKLQHYSSKDIESLIYMLL